MNNRYLYRAKRIDNGEWVEGSYVYTFAPDNECPVVGVHKENHWIVEKNGNIVIVDTSTICACTGLKDKNGRLIWENDIVNPFSTLKGIVRFGVRDYSKEFGFYIEWMSESCYRKDFTYWNEKIEVVGNIFDNPELLEVDK